MFTHFLFQSWLKRTTTMHLYYIYWFSTLKEQNIQVSSVHICFGAQFPASSTQKTLMWTGLAQLSFLLFSIYFSISILTHSLPLFVLKINPDQDLTLAASTSDGVTRYTERVMGESLKYILSELVHHFKFWFVFKCVFINPLRKLTAHIHREKITDMWCIFASEY